jgi:putative ABC transport system substrate-binding protein
VRRRRFLATLGAVALDPPAIAQAPAGARRIGLLWISATSRVEAFREGLRELGWVEGQNVVIDYRSAEGRLDSLPDLAGELVRLKVDIIVAVATPAAAAAKNATPTIPIVMISVADPVGLGLVASLAHPGGNVTGLAYTSTSGKELELLKEIIPEVRRVAILSNPGNTSNARAIRNIEATARSLAVQLQLLEARAPNEFDAAFAAMAKERVGALLVLADPVFYSTRLADLAARSRLPAAYGLRETVEAGGLMSYGPRSPDLWRRAAAYVDKILKGANPAELPVEQPTKFELVINLKTAKVLGLTIPQSVLLRADEVIQ